jgi:hypothetical protein
MLVGVPKEIKDNAYGVGMVPSTVRELADKGHRGHTGKPGRSGRRIADNVKAADSVRLENDLRKPKDRLAYRRREAGECTQRAEARQ